MDSDTTITPSTQYSLNAIDWKKIGKGAIMALGGALLTYIAQTIPNIDFGNWTPFVTAVLAVVMNTSHKFITSNQ